MYLNYYKELLDYKDIPDFLIKYLNAPSLNRLKNVSYFCGMDYASKDIYNFREPISRFDHSLTVALLVYKLTHNKKYTIMGLFHDIGTPCFSHVIDYMNGDYELQESTEKNTEYIIRHDPYLLQCLIKDNINFDDIINFKRCSIVDNERPKLCADRLDGVILTGIGWTKNIEKDDIKNIVNDISITTNEFNEQEISFSQYDVANKVLEVSKSIDFMCHSNEDNYMMNLLAEITKQAIFKKYLKYEDLFLLNEKQLFDILFNIPNLEIRNYLYVFKNIKLKEIPDINLTKVKVRRLSPLVNGKRII